MKFRLVLAILLIPSLAIAQTRMDSTESPPNVGAGNQMPEPANSLPQGAGTGGQTRGGSMTTTVHRRRHVRATSQQNPSAAMSRTEPRSSVN